VRSSRTTAFIARRLLVMLGPHCDKSIRLFDAILFPRLKDDEEDI
jgi:hypothetical protein